MRNRILGIIGVVWGFLVLQRLWFNGPPRNPADGSVIGVALALLLVWGTLMFGAGLYYLLRGDGDWPWKKKPRKKSAQYKFRIPA